MDRIQETRENYANPRTCFFHVIFKAAALAFYILSALFFNSFVIIFVVTVFLAALDFWVVKNVSGRILVGLRWWNEINEQGESVWKFECLDHESLARMNKNLAIKPLDSPSDQMSLTRTLFNEFRPVFQMLDDPFFGDPFSLVPQRQASSQPNNTAADSPWTRTPHVHLSDENDKYVVEAEVPGVPKENLDVSIGDNGRSLTIKGDTFSSSNQYEKGKGKIKEVSSEDQVQARNGADAGVDKADTPAETAVVEPEATPKTRWSSRSSFARTIWLPKPVDARKVAARLDHGILTLEIPKLQAQNHRITVS